MKGKILSIFFVIAYIWQITEAKIVADCQKWAHVIGIGSNQTGTTRNCAAITGNTTFGVEQCDKPDTYLCNAPVSLAKNQT